jgi:uncharacterized protein YndB with AHSA1/START domain
MNDAVSQSQSSDIVIDDIFPHTPETIWKALTSGALMSRWLGMAPANFEPVVGNRFTYQTTAAGAWDGKIHCEILDVIPNERLRYSWSGGHEGNNGYGSLLNTIVTFTLKKVSGGTRLSLVHSGFVLPRNETAYRNMSGGWQKVVPRLIAIASEGTSTNTPD